MKIVVTFLQTYEQSEVNTDTEYDMNDDGILSPVLSNRSHGLGRRSKHLEDDVDSGAWSSRSNEPNNKLVYS